jgi:hypothetical protein
MAYDQTLTAEIRKALSGYTVEEKKAFGGLAFMVRGKMCVSINTRPDHIMMVRIDPQDQEEALQRKGAKLAVMRGKTMQGWIFLTREAIETQKDFDYWVKIALKYNNEITK